MNYLRFRKTIAYLKQFDTIFIPIEQNTIISAYVMSIINSEMPINIALVSESILSSVIALLNQRQGADFLNEINTVFQLNTMLLNKILSELTDNILSVTAEVSMHNGNIIITTPETNSILVVQECEAIINQINNFNINALVSTALTTASFYMDAVPMLTDVNISDNTIATIAISIPESSVILIDITDNMIASGNLIELDALYFDISDTISSSESILVKLYVSTLTIEDLKLYTIGEFKDLTILELSS